MKMKTVKVSKKSLMTKMSMRRSSQPCKLYCHHNINKPKHCKYKRNYYKNKKN